MTTEPKIGPMTVEKRSSEREPKQREPIFELSGVEVAYSGKVAVRDIGFDIASKEITALIGPSGCGKSTLLRCLNRMNDLIPGAAVEGRIDYHGQDLYGAGVDPVEVRKRIGMVFQKPNPFPKSIYDNVAYGPKIHGLSKSKADLDQIVESSLKKAALWNEVTVCSPMVLLHGLSVSRSGR